MNIIEKTKAAAAELEAEDILNMPTSLANSKVKGKRVNTKEEEAFYASVSHPKMPEVGEVLDCKVTHATNTDIWVDAGLKHSVQVSRNSAEDEMVDGKLSTEDVTRVLITLIKGDVIKGSLVGAISADMATHVLQLMKDATPVEATVISNVNHLQLSVDGLEGVKIIMQHSQTDLNKVQDLDALVGTTMKVLFDGSSADNSVFFVSRKKYLESIAPAAIKKLRNRVLYTGKITGITDFGVFVQFNECLSGMIHLANINPEYLDVIKEVPVGTEIDFYVKEIVKGKIMLTQVHRESVWDTIKSGQVLSGQVVGMKEFGLMVKFDEETKGLVHTSEIPEDFKYEEGAQIKVLVLSVSRSERKIYLGLI